MDFWSVERLKGLVSGKEEVQERNETLALFVEANPNLLTADEKLHLVRTNSLYDIFRTLRQILDLLEERNTRKFEQEMSIFNLRRSLDDSQF